ncbi:MAG TPA: hypothetical protein VI172_04170, partial [Candidatus Dormibacteraeota bacterium]
MARRSALDNRRFRTVLLASAGIPIVLDYLWRTLVGPLLTGSMPLDFAENYLPAAAKIAAGRDPYDLCVIQGCAAGGAYTPL